MAVLAALGVCLVVRAQTAASPVGVWKTIDDKSGKAKSHIQIWEHKGVLYGKILKLIDPPSANPKCINCEGAMHNVPVVGMTIMRGLTRDGDEWNGGTVLDPESGKTYNVLLVMENGGKTLKVRGYIGLAMLGRTQRWQRVK